MRMNTPSIPCSLGRMTPTELPIWVSLSWCMGCLRNVITFVILAPPRALCRSAVAHQPVAPGLLGAVQRPVGTAQQGLVVRVAIEVGEIATVTPAQRNQAEKTERHAAAVVALEQDPFVRELIARFDATLEVASVKPL
mgnify:CR=1 FL=1